ncbi:hypothetical protein A2765_03420 [Candidatus Kaiserbacteria bacterium RIFCSPHIGHO2_01_FULL_56_24]|uniref:Uncharacterized protein n=1 Tax=Candidatus Kaiserbacteria bacterium RIFCSPHIGHO2_01_FULL_56_24 TaxID=1798487 RepID=A0A1F6D8N9_9BACT|nr:MAG: hypothetical protein A2765_03420 [Candidatus Kaiserbacteria bacterium RIFCSPHIGHO2_01_FULL_56_24]
MSKEMTVIALGILVMLSPYLGIPGHWRTLLVVILGAALALIGFLLRGEQIRRGSTPTDRHPFVEHVPDNHFEKN